MEIKAEVKGNGLPEGYEEMNPRKQRKYRYGIKLRTALNEYKNILLCTIDNVGSNQMQQVRLALRGKAVLLMGKNTIIRKIIDEEAVKNPLLNGLAECIRGNIGFVFTNGDLKEVKDIVLSNRVPAAAKTGAFAPIDVFIPPGPTGLDPGQTNFFQALNIATKITRGSIEILNQVHLIKAKERISASAVALLSKLKIKPFFFGFEAKFVYEAGAVYPVKVLEMGQEVIVGKFFSSIRYLSALCLATNYPTLASLPHSINRGFAKLVAISLATEYVFDESKIFKEIAANPNAFKAAAQAPIAGGGGGKVQAKAPEPEPEPVEEAAAEFSLFD
jgi:large subunit ribosomal protein LP0